MERLDVWLDRKHEPKQITTKTNKPMLTIRATMETEAYEAWKAMKDHSEIIPPTRYANLKLVVVGNQGLIDHLLRVAKKPRPEGDPRHDCHVVGRWGETETWDYNEQTYSSDTFWVDAASPLIWQPFSK